MRALVIDDSKAMRNILRGILKQIGFEVFEAADGKDGLKRLDEIGSPDLILVDWNMPGMDGLAFVRAARAIDCYRNTPLMMVTTETEFSQIQLALDAGANEFVMKPFTKDVLVDKLNLIGISCA